LDCDFIKATAKIVQKDQYKHVWLKCTTMMKGWKLPKGIDGQDYSTRKSSRSFIFTYKLTGKARNKRSQFRERMSIYIYPKTKKKIIKKGFWLKMEVFWANIRERRIRREKKTKEKKKRKKGKNSKRKRNSK